MWNTQEWDHGHGGRLQGTEGAGSTRDFAGEIGVAREGFACSEKFIHQSWRRGVFLKDAKDWNRLRGKTYPGRCPHVADCTGERDYNTLLSEMGFQY